MLIRLEHREWLMVGRGIAALFICIVAGSIVVEIQLNQLTYWMDFIRVFNLRQVAEGSYYVYILGIEYYIKASCQVGTIAAKDTLLDVNMLGFGVTIPTQMSVDGSLILAFIQTMWQQIIEYAFIGKRYCSDFLTGLMSSFRLLYHQISGIIK